MSVTSQGPFGDNSKRILTAAFCLGLAACCQAAPIVTAGPPKQAPPPAPPIQTAPVASVPSEEHRRPLGVTVYSIGQPTDEEQLYLELLNRMRANPTAEAQRLATTTDPNILSAYAQFMVDLNLMQAEFVTNPPVPPLAINAQLTAAARWHSGDMFTNQYQGHFQNNGAVVMNPGDRIASNGYTAFTWGENVFSYADSVPFGHAGFAVDWGNSTGGSAGGMQTPPGHRDNMLAASFREIGIGVVDGVNGSVGPQLVTQDFATQQSSPTFITGVVYFDLNGNGFYDPGEGIGGVTANTSASSYFAVTANSGGYAIPVNSNGNYVLTFTAPGVSNQVAVAINNLHNAKVDLVLSYSPPAISGPNPAALNQSNTYTFTPVPGATSYQWLQATLASYTLVEGGENGLANVTIVSSPGYSVLATDRHASGTHSFNLQHLQATDQILAMNPTLLVSAGSQLNFAELLGFALTNEVAEAQVSADGGQTWQTVWSKPGNDGSSSVDSAFVNQSISLGAYAGQVVQVRFVYAYFGGFYIPGGSGSGIYLDSIALSNAQQVIGAVTNNVGPNTSFSFMPTTVTNYLLQVRPQVNSRLLSWGPAFPVSVSTVAPTPILQLVSAPALVGGQVQLDFTVTNYRSGMIFELLKATDLGNWSVDASATLRTNVPGSHFRFTTSVAGQRGFFRIKGS